MHREETKTPKIVFQEKHKNPKLEDDIAIWKTRRYELNQFNEETSVKFEHDCKHRKG